MIIQTIKDTPKLKTFHSSRGHSPVLFVSLTWGPIPQLLKIVRFSHLGAHSPVVEDRSFLSPGGPIPQLLWIVRFSHLGAPFPSYCGLFASLTWGPHSPVIVDCSLLSPGGPIPQLLWIVRFSHLGAPLYYSNFIAQIKQTTVCY